MLVNIAALRLLVEGPLRRAVVIASVAACALAILVWPIYTLQTKPQTLTVFLDLLVACMVIEVILQRATRRRIGSARAGRGEGETSPRFAA